MTRIISLRYSDLNKVRKMIEYVNTGISPDRISEEAYVHFPFNTIHGLLPLRLKFLQECYVAVEGDNLLGLISLVPDGNQKTRWKINRLILNPNAFDAGKQLVDFVVNKYGGAGVETFLTTIDENYAEAIALFKNACSFRNNSKISIWETTAHSAKTDASFTLRQANSFDVQKLFELDTESILPKYRTSLLKNTNDFSFGAGKKFINKLKGNIISAFVLDNPEKQSIECFLSIMTRDNKNFWLDINISQAYQQYYEDVLNFALNYINGQNKDAKIFAGVRDFHQTAGKAKEVLASNNFNQRAGFEILVKDYWKPAEYSAEKKVPIMIFPDLTSPACNIIRFIKEF